MESNMTQAMSKFTSNTMQRTTLCFLPIKLERRVARSTRTDGYGFMPTLRVGYRRSMFDASRGDLSANGNENLLQRIVGIIAA
jgi:hypothetical protein